MKSITKNLSSIVTTLAHSIQKILKKILLSIRAHWQIENNLHWLLDVAYREDQSRIRDENAALNMSWLRKTALGLLKRATSIQGSIRRKQLTLWANPESIIEIVKI